MTKAEIKEVLDANGVSYDENAKKDELESLLQFTPDTTERTGGERVANLGTPELNSDVNANEHTVEDQQKLEKELSDEDAGIQARVIQSAKNYVKIKWFRDNKPFVTYKSRTFDKSDAKKFLKESRDFYNV